MQMTYFFEWPHVQFVILLSYYRDKITSYQKFSHNLTFEVQIV